MSTLPLLSGWGEKHFGRPKASLLLPNIDIYSTLNQRHNFYLQPKASLLPATGGNFSTYDRRHPLYLRLQTSLPSDPEHLFYPRPKASLPSLTQGNFSYPTPESLQGISSTPTKGISSTTYPRRLFNANQWHLFNFQPKASIYPRSNEFLPPPTPGISSTSNQRHLFPWPKASLLTPIHTM